MTLEVTDLNINDTDQSWDITPYLVLTTHRGMVGRFFFELDYPSSFHPTTVYGTETAAETEVHFINRA